MPTPEPTTLRLRIYWSYANLTMAHAAVAKGATKYGRLHWMIRAKTYKGLHTGSMNIGSLLADERVKLENAQTCAYCGQVARLTLDHLVPKVVGGADSGDNTVWACRSCNSSKGSQDVMVWFPVRFERPVPLLLVRRYLKLALAEGAGREVLDLEIAALPVLRFDPACIPLVYPPPGECVLWSS